VVLLLLVSIDLQIIWQSNFDLHTEFRLWIDGLVMRHQKIFQLMMMKDLDSGDLEQAPLGIDIIQFPTTILQKKGKLWSSQWIHVGICRHNFSFFSVQNDTRKIKQVLKICFLLWLVVNSSEKPYMVRLIWNMNQKNSDYRDLSNLYITETRIFNILMNIKIQHQWNFVKQKSSKRFGLREFQNFKKFNLASWKNLLHNDFK